MNTIIGKVIKKQKSKNPAKVKLLVQDDAGIIHKLQVRPKHLIKIAEIDTGANIQVSYVRNITENLIVEDIIIVQ